MIGVSLWGSQVRQILRERRFGPDALEWNQCSTLREYIRHGLMQASGFYITTVCILLLLSASGRPGPVAYVSTA